MPVFNLKFFNRVSTAPSKAAKRAFGYSGGTYVDEDSALQVAAFYRGLMYVSTQIAKLPCLIKDAANNVISDDIANLLDLAPNKEMNAMTFKLFMIQQAIIHGNSYAEIERRPDGRVVALHPMNTRDVEPYRDVNDKLWYRIVGGSVTNSGQDVYLRPTDVFHLRNFHTKDGVSGQGVISYALDILGISLGADTLANSLFANGGMPSGVLTAPGELSDAAYDRLKADWKERHGGKKSGGVAILEEGLKFEPLAFPPEVMQFLESRKFNVYEIARYLGVPPSKLFDPDSMTYNNIEHANLEVVTDTLDAWAKNWEMESDIKVLNRRKNGRRTEIDLYSVFRGDMDTRATYFNKMMNVGAITPNEIRTKEGMSPYKEGNRQYIATNNFTPVDKIDAVIDAKINPPKVDTNKKTETEEELDKTVTDFFKKRSV